MNRFRGALALTVILSISLVYIFLLESATYDVVVSSNRINNIILTPDDEDEGNTTHSHSHYHQHHRSLRFSKFFDPKSVVPRITRTKLTLYMVGRDMKEGTMFKTDILQRYATGRFNYVIEHTSQLDHACNKEISKQIAPRHDIPCLAIFFPRPAKQITTNLIRCNFPRCKVMIMADETCRWPGSDVREFYTTDKKFEGKGYLPLGPRIDSWTSFQKIQEDPLFHITPVSKRKYAFNAIFSKSTSSSRARLANVLENEGDYDNLSIYKAIAEQWYMAADNPNTPQLHTSEYMKILLDSVFTLSPAGHNPECYRLYESVEAGSIPIMLRDDMHAHGSGGKCKGSLYEWFDAPIVVLDSWDELYPRVRELMADLQALDMMQIKLRLWYDDYMSKVVSNFEDFMIMSYPKGVGKVNATYSS